MIEVTGDLWTYPADVRVITTNGTVKASGEAVMGRGCALEAKQRWPKLPAQLGADIAKGGNKVRIELVDQQANYIVCFPVKHHWRSKADLDLIRTSTLELVVTADILSWQTVVLPRPGCGNGQRDWETEVKPILEPILDDRFHVITYG